MSNKSIKLSFDDTKKTVTRRKNGKTIVRLFAYVNVKSFESGICNMNYDAYDKVLDMGFRTDYNYGIKGGVIYFYSRGETTLQEGDVDNPDVAVRIASTKAKVNAYRLFSRLLDMIEKNYRNGLENISNTRASMKKFEQDELEALERCRKTVYCDPSKK